MSSSPPIKKRASERPAISATAHDKSSVKKPKDKKKALNKEALDLDKEALDEQKKNKL